MSVPWRRILLWKWSFINNYTEPSWRKFWSGEFGNWTQSQPEVLFVFVFVFWNFMALTKGICCFIFSSLLLFFYLPISHPSLPPLSLSVSVSFLPSVFHSLCLLLLHTRCPALSHPVFLPRLLSAGAMQIDVWPAKTQHMESAARSPTINECLFSGVICYIVHLFCPFTLSILYVISEILLNFKTKC